MLHFAQTAPGPAAHLGYGCLAPRSKSAIASWLFCLPLKDPTETPQDATGATALLVGETSYRSGRDVTDALGFDPTYRMRRHELTPFSSKHRRPMAAIAFQLQEILITI